MRNIFHPLLLIAGATEKELARQVMCLKEESRILRSKLPARVVVTRTERSRLVWFAKGLGKVLNELAAIVRPETLQRRIRGSRG